MTVPVPPGPQGSPATGATPVADTICPPARQAGNTTYPPTATALPSVAGAEASTADDVTSGTLGVEEQATASHNKPVIGPTPNLRTPITRAKGAPPCDVRPMLTNDPYRDPFLYDLEYATDSDDVAYYLSLALRHAPDGTIIELGCGNGRISLPIARCGVTVHGIDASAAMLDSFRLKLSRESSEVREAIQLQIGDFCALPPTAKRYPLAILPFNALHHCPSITAVERLLRGVSERLVPAGLFALDAYLPDPTLYARDPKGRYEQREFVDPSTGQLLQSWEEGWWDAETGIHHVIYVYQRPWDAEDRLHLRLHMYEQGELLDAFARCGFLVEAEWADFQETPMHASAVKWVFQLRKL